MQRAAADFELSIKGMGNGDPEELVTAFDQTAAALFKQLEPIAKMVQVKRENNKKGKPVHSPVSIEEQTRLVRDLADKLRKNDFAAPALFPEFIATFADRFDQKVVDKLESQLNKFEYVDALETLEMLCHQLDISLDF